MTDPTTDRFRARVLGCRRQRGQTSVLMAVLLLVVLVLALGLARVGRAAIDRSAARTAADAVALAAPTGSDASAELERWYNERGVVIETGSNRAWAGAGRSQAAAWAMSEPAAISAAPAVVAIVARAEQLLGRPLAALDLDGVAVWFTLEEAALFAAVAADLGMCPAGSTSMAAEYVLC